MDDFELDYYWDDEGNPIERVSRVWAGGVRWTPRPAIRFGKKKQRFIQEYVDMSTAGLALFLQCHLVSKEKINGRDYSLSGH
jgi:hypothetical protein